MRDPRYDPQPGDRLRPQYRPLAWLVIKRTARTVACRDGGFVVKCSLKYWRDSIIKEAEVQQ